MGEFLALGIDCGGTHTDAALLLVNEEAASARILAGAKTGTIHENLPLSIANVIKELSGAEGGASWIDKVERVTLGTTLAINAIVQNREDAVGLAVCAGPGLDPRHFTLGNHVCVVPGGLDHRGKEVTPLYLDELRREAEKWPEENVRAIACVGKFSPRNPEHEKRMAETAAKFSHLPVTLGHELSGSLNFPRRIATAYYNAAIMNLHGSFLDSVETTLGGLGIKCQCRLLKADGGAIPFTLSRRQPVQSILSGPAASVMGMQALKAGNAECLLFLDIGGTTTDIALIFKNSPVLERGGMKIKMRRTLVKSLASHSIGIGGDSLISLVKTDNGRIKFQVGPERVGPAMAFGGSQPTLLDALNICDEIESAGERGDGRASREGFQKMLEVHIGHAHNPKEAATEVVQTALQKIVRAVYDLVENVNSQPIYTLAGLRNIQSARPQAACVAGGPAECMSRRLANALGMPVNVSPHPHIANAVGAALTIPTASLEIYVDGAAKVLTAPALGIRENISASFTLEDAKKRARQLLEQHMLASGVEKPKTEIVEADLFAVLDDGGYGSRDIRVVCQARPGICAFVR